MNNEHEWILCAIGVKRSSDAISKEIFSFIKNFADDQNYKDEIDDADYSLFRNQLYELLLGYYLLIGYAIENLIKGKSIQNWRKINGEIETTDFIFLKKNIWKVKSNAYSMLDISFNSDITLNERERKILKSLEKYIVWASKYPAPVSQVNISKFNNQDLLKSTAEDVEDCELLYERLLTESGYNSIPF